MWLWPTIFGQPDFYFYFYFENVACLAQLLKKVTFAVLEFVLSEKNTILSAPQLQGSKSNIVVHFHLVNKQLIGIPFQMKTINKASN